MKLLSLLFSVCLSSFFLAFWPFPLDAHVESIIVKMTENGFEPREVAVDTESFINFVNDDSVARWPASNVHPSHELYPEFDPLEPIAPGDFWIFKPRQPGTWKYHDHLFPHKRGTLTVISEPSNNPVASDALPTKSNWVQKLQTFFGEFWRLVSKPFRGQLGSVKGLTTPITILNAKEFEKLAEAEQYNYLEKLSRAAGLADTWQYVKSTYTSDTGAALGGRAHDLAHYVGELMYTQEGLSGLSLCDTTFAFGCYHGFTEAAFATSLDALNEVAASCATLSPVSSGPWASCIHGIGHGVATYFDAVELTNALATCDELEGATYCHDGVFMEFSFSAPPNFYQPDNPLYPCSELDEKYLPACGRNQPHVMQRKFNLNRSAIAATCQKTNHQGLIAACIDSLGFGIANESRGDHETIISQCGELIGDAIQAQCVAAAAGELVFQNYPNWRQVSHQACQQLAPRFRAQCLDRVQQTAHNYNR